jgi:A/G-specific adenine glycosylase
MDFRNFKKEIWNYYHAYGRHTMPWRKTKDPYKIMISEYMLQQTQVSRVIEKYAEFLKAFPTIKSLAKASNTQVLKIWQGLGYNRRALYLKQAAESIQKKYNGKVPHTIEELIELPGIGKNTAGAISAYAFNIPAAYIETNIRRVYIHFFFKNKNNVHDTDILKLVEKTLDKKNPREWCFALMDYGKYLCKVVENPNRKSKHYIKQSKFKGSDRELRGKILRILLKANSISKVKIFTELNEEKLRVEKVLETLVRDRFVSIEKGKLTLLN